MTTYVLRDGKLVPKHMAAPKHVAHARAAYVISDAMEPMRHMGTGAIVSSKAEFRRHTRAAGCVEVGTDPAAARPGKPYEPPSLVPFVQRAIQTLETR